MVRKNPYELVRCTSPSRRCTVSVWACTMFVYYTENVKFVQLFILNALIYRLFFNFDFVTRYQGVYDVCRLTCKVEVINERAQPLEPLN